MKRIFVDFKPKFANYITMLVTDVIIICFVIVLWPVRGVGICEAFAAAQKIEAGKRV